MNVNRRAAFVTLAGLVASMRSIAATYPSRPITLVVPFAPGGNMDVAARTLAVPLARILGTSVIVDNRAGGGGAVGASLVARAEPDGYTLLIAAPGQVATVPRLIRTNYGPASFKSIGGVSRTTMVLVTRQAESRLSGVRELIHAAQAKAGSISAGHAGPGTPNHLALLQFEDVAGVQFNAVPYKGSAPALADLLGGQIELVFDQVTSSMPYLKSGTLKALAVLSSTPEPSLPGVPTLGQLGLAAFDATTYVGALAPAATPDGIAKALGQALSAAVADPSLAHTLGELGSAPFPADAQRLRSLVAAEDEVAARLIKSGRLQTS